MTEAAAGPSDPAREVGAVLDAWCGGVNAHSLDGKMSAYADVVSPFFGKRRATKAEIRKVFASPFDRWEHMSQRLERVDVKVSGETAVARVYKTWDYDGHRGWAEERIGFTRMSDGWRITSEQDIRASE